MKEDRINFWNSSLDDIYPVLRSTFNGLSQQEAQQRISVDGQNSLKSKKNYSPITLFLTQFKSPIILILLFATGLSFFVHDQINAVIILSIVLISGVLSFWQEYSATNAMEKLINLVKTKVKVCRDGQEIDVFIEEIIAGDIVVLNAGDVIAGDCRLIESKNLFVDEAALTGETYPVEKIVSTLPIDTPLSKRSNCLWMGTHVISGGARAIVVATGKQTIFGELSEKLKLRPEETEFELGIKHFGYFLMEVTLVLVILIFAINVYLARPMMEAFLFSLALAVGLTPQLLPAIITINLSHGAKRMASQNVIVKKLNSIENFGSMNILCSDKTGTLTQGIVVLDSCIDFLGKAYDKIFEYAHLNASFETGFNNPIDDAIRKNRQLDIRKYTKLDEIPYDFMRKRLTVLVQNDSEKIIITKGALSNILDVCSFIETSDGKIKDIATVKESINQQFIKISQQGFRTLGVAYKNKNLGSLVKKDDEANMIFLGFMVFVDPLKPAIAQTVASLKQLGVSLKMITGDNQAVATSIGQQVGFVNPNVLNGLDLNKISDEALIQKVSNVDVFAEVEPNQKERIILALKKCGNVVGYMGDGINDAPALHAADVGISVDSAVDVAKEAADIILLEHNLNILIQGVREGRTTFANTLKYVFMATSANFGNMFSMAGASIFLSFLPLLPKQVLITNLLTDFPEMAIASDSVDAEFVEKPQRWNINFIKKFMVVFGMISSIFDYLTFAVLIFILHATPSQFRTGWFLESVISATLIVLVVRTRGLFLKSKPGRNLIIATVGVILFVSILSYLPFAGVFGFEPLPKIFLIFITIIIFYYVITAEITKKIFYNSLKV